MSKRREIKKLIGIDTEDLGMAEVLDILSVDLKDLKLLEGLILDEVFGLGMPGLAMRLMLERAEKMPFYLERL